MFATRSSRPQIIFGLALIVHAMTGPTAMAILQAPDANTSDDIMRRYSQPIAGVDWDELSPHFVQMLDRVFERNGWNDESDQFARKVASRVAEIPPWDMAGRFGVLSDEVSQRYGLSPQQTAGFQRAVLRETAGMLVRHGPKMWQQAQEALQGRSQGKPYTIEQIARWAKDADPLFREIETSANRIAEEVGRGLPEEKKKVLDGDMAGFHKRQKAVEQMNRRWAQGQWKPDEWGLEDDPIQTGGRANAAAAAAPAPVSNSVPSPSAPTPLVVPGVQAPPIPDRWVEHAPATWIALVIEIGKRYSLDKGQMDAAWSIHDELVERAQRHVQSNASVLAEIPAAQRGTHEAYRPIRDLFGELRSRLEAIPTSAQREAAR